MGFCCRIKKIGGITPFNLWLIKELEAFFYLVNVVKTSLQVGNAIHFL